MRAEQSALLARQKRTAALAGLACAAYRAHAKQSERSAMTFAGMPGAFGSPYGAPAAAPTSDLFSNGGARQPSLGNTAPKEFDFVGVRTWCLCGPSLGEPCLTALGRFCWHSWTACTARALGRILRSRSMQEHLGLRK